MIINVFVTNPHTDEKIMMEISEIGDSNWLQNYPPDRIEIPIAKQDCSIVIRDSEESLDVIIAYPEEDMPDEAIWSYAKEIASEGQED